MSEKSKDELIQTQKEVIGILFEIIKRFQANNQLDEEYFHLISYIDKKKIDKTKLEKILKTREENSKVISKLLEKLEI